MVDGRHGSLLNRLLLRRLLVGCATATREQKIARTEPTDQQHNGAHGDHDDELGIGALPPFRLNLFRR
ncbi:MAG: hypothetical protein AB2813_02005 [Candidatus Sedimenticola endophacoides]